jgi:hypothetical protein
MRPFRITIVARSTAGRPVPSITRALLNAMTPAA